MIIMIALGEGAVISARRCEGRVVGAYSYLLACRPEIDRYDLPLLPPFPLLLPP